MTTLGFVVLAKRPGCDPEPVKMRGRDTGVVFTGPNALEQAQNAREYCDGLNRYVLDPVEYVVGEIVPV